MKTVEIEPAIWPWILESLVKGLMASEELGEFVEVEDGIVQNENRLVGVYFGELSVNHSLQSIFCSLQSAVCPAVHIHIYAMLSHEPRSGIVRVMNTERTVSGILVDPRLRPAMKGAIRGKCPGAKYHIFKLQINRLHLHIGTILRGLEGDCSGLKDLYI